MNPAPTQKILSVATTVWGLLLLPWSLLAFVTIFLAGAGAILSRTLLLWTWGATYSLPLTILGAVMWAGRLQTGQRYRAAVLVVLAPIVQVGVIILAWILIITTPTAFSR